MQITVECYAGYKSEQTPRVLVLEGRRVPVERVIGQWIAPDHRYFKVLGNDNGIYIVRYDVMSDMWELATRIEPDM